MARPAGFEPATYGLEERTPELHELLILQQLIENRQLDRLHVLGDSLDFSKFWTDFLTRSLTQPGVISGPFGWRSDLQGLKSPAMANPEHLAILEQGVEVWNQWREEKRPIYPNLLEADLRGRILRGIHLEGANLYRTELYGADLRNSRLNGARLVYARLDGARLCKASLHEVNMMWANLSSADLTEANLSNSNMFAANLTSANLTKALLRDTNLTSANLFEANLEQAHLNRTGLAGVSLKNALGIGDCHFGGGCWIDLRTIASSWPLPDSFLRGCGLTEAYLEALPSFVETLQYNSCFICYSHADREFAAKLHRNLEEANVACWFDEKDIRSGRKLYDQIGDAIRKFDRLLLILSEHSMVSNWVKTEIANARQRETNEGKQVLFPIRLVDFEAIKEWSLFDADTGIDSAREIREYFIPDFSDWKNPKSYKKAFERLLRDLKSRFAKNMGTEIV